MTDTLSHLLEVPQDIDARSMCLQSQKKSKEEDPGKCKSINITMIMRVNY